MAIQAGPTERTYSAPLCRPGRPEKRLRAPSPEQKGICVSWGNPHFYIADLQRIADRRPQHDRISVMVNLRKCRPIMRPSRYRRRTIPIPNPSKRNRRAEPIRILIGNVIKPNLNASRARAIVASRSIKSGDFMPSVKPYGSRDWNDRHIAKIPGILIW